MNPSNNSDENLAKNQKDNTPIQSDNVENLNKIGFFKGKGHHLYIHKKSQKLITAIYLVTDFLKDNEPLKWKIRGQGLSLLSYNLSLVNAFTADKKLILDNISSVCLEIISMIEIGYVAGIISSMNFSILKKEFIDLINLIEEKENPKNLGSNYVLSESFLKVEQDLLKDVSETQTSNEISKGHNNKGQQNVLNKMSLKSPYSNVLNQETRNSNSVNTGSLRTDKNDRQIVIINTLKKMKEVTIKDLLSVISDCSEKTIQRELLALVAKGVLKKTGERRWSRYSLS
jgi:hypothetical protein